MEINTPHLPDEQDWQRELLSRQPTMDHPALMLPPEPEHRDLQQQSDTTAILPDHTIKPNKRRKLARVIALLCVLVSIVVLYLTLRGSTNDTGTSTSTTQVASTVGPAASATATQTSSSGGTSIQVYIVGAVKHPGVYTLDAKARAYQLLKAAGGPQADANLVAVNLAAPLKDGQEVYVPAVGETVSAGSAGSTTNSTAPPRTSTGSGQLVNINTASETELRQQLHVSAHNASAIVSYRTQHGPYTSVDQLANVVSKSVYDKIKGMVTV